jgi:hypothetical protein
MNKARYFFIRTKSMKLFHQGIKLYEKHSLPFSSKRQRKCTHDGTTGAMFMYVSTYGEFMTIAWTLRGRLPHYLQKISGVRHKARKD